MIVFYVFVLVSIWQKALAVSDACKSSILHANNGAHISQVQAV